MSSARTRHTRNESLLPKISQWRVIFTFIRTERECSPGPPLIIRTGPPLIIRNVRAVDKKKSEKTKKIKYKIPFLLFVVGEDIALPLKFVGFSGSPRNNAEHGSHLFR